MRIALAALALLTCFGGAAVAQEQVFLYTYDGQVWEDGVFGQLGSTSYTVGQIDSLAPYMSRGAGCTWTFYLSNLVAVTAQNYGDSITFGYSGGDIEVHEDCVNNPAYCYGDTRPPSDCSPGTFIDGDEVLGGYLQNFSITINIHNGIGHFGADCFFTSGTLLSELPANSGWTLGSTITRYKLPGYQHYTTGSVILNIVTPAQPTTWGHIKSLYRS